MKSRGCRTSVLLLAVLMQVCFGQSPVADPWQQDRPANLPQIKNLEVMCAKDHMEVQLSFDKPFSGLVFSKGQFGSDNCVYVHPKSGRNSFRFSITYQGCGTKPDAKGKFYENTVVVQYDEELIEVWDEAKRLRCEWYNDYEKTATKPPMVIADLEVVELNFRGDNVDCWMEIQNGKGPWASPIAGIVPLGSTLTMVVAINDHAGEFDMRVKSCEASDGVNRPIQLSDERGCVLRPKMVSKFLKLRSNDGRSTVMSYAFFHAFKFPDSLQVYIRCKVEICRFGCPEHCDKSNNRLDQAYATSEAHASFSHAAALQQPAPAASSIPTRAEPTFLPSAKPVAVPLPQFNPLPEPHPLVAPQPVPLAPQPVPLAPQPVPLAPQQTILPAQQVSQRRTPVPVNAAPVAPAPVAAAPSQPKRPFFGIGRPKSSDQPASEMRPPRIPFLQRKKDETPSAEAQVVAVPISIPGSQPANQLAQDPVVVPESQATVVQKPALEVQERQEAENSHPLASRLEQAPGKFAERTDVFPKGPRSLNLDELDLHVADIEKYADHSTKGSRRTKRYALHERRIRSADVGVRVGYEVISAVDLAFTPNASADGITIFQSRMKSEDVVYGICLPAPGFSALFVLLAMCVVISVLVASFLCYHRQLQKNDREGVCIDNSGPASRQQPVIGMATPAVPFRDWSMVQFFGRTPKNF